MTSSGTADKQGHMNRLEKSFVNSRVNRSRVGRKAELLLQHVPGITPGWRMLDIGCGVGAGTIAAARGFGLKVVGIDVDPAQVLAAQTHGAGSPDVRFETVDAQRLPFGDGEFDVVYTSKATHHIPDWKVALEEAIRVLRKPFASAEGGSLVYVDFFVPGTVSRLASLLPSHRGGLPNHSDLDAFIQHHRLRIVHRHHAGLYGELVLQRT